MPLQDADDVRAAAKPRTFYKRLIQYLYDISGAERVTPQTPVPERELGANSVTARAEILGALRRMAQSLTPAMQPTILVSGSPAFFYEVTPAIHGRTIWAQTRGNISFPDNLPIGFKLRIFTNKQNVEINSNTGFHGISPGRVIIEAAGSVSLYTNTAFPGEVSGGFVDFEVLTGGVYWCFGTLIEV